MEPFSATPAKTFLMWVKILDWHDGDTFHGVLDLGFGIYLGRIDKPLRIRCALINAPEIDTDEGKASKAYAQSLAPEGDYPCASYGWDTYGRPLVDVRLPMSEGYFSAAILKAGFAHTYSRALRVDPSERPFA